MCRTLSSVRQLHLFFLKMLKKIFQNVLFLFFFAACSAPEGGIPTGEDAPEIRAVDLDGKMISLADYKGKVLMLYFWADFCPACKKEFPATQAYYETLKGADFEILAINVAQKRQVSADFRKEYKASFPMIADLSSEISGAYRVKNLPVVYFISPEGKIIRQFNAWVDQNQVRVMINQHKKK